MNFSLCGRGEGESSSVLGDELKDRESAMIGIVGVGYWGPNLIRNFASTSRCRLVV